MTYRVEIPLPADFRPLNSVQLNPWYGSGYWYVTVFGSFDGAAMRQYVFRWKPGIIAERVPLVQETTDRGAIGVHDAGAAIFGWDGQKLIVQSVDFVPAPLDARVGELVEEIAALKQQIAELETALGTVGAGSLTDEDRGALDWVRAVRAIP